MSSSDDSSLEIARIRWRGDRAETCPDRLVREEPLEIRIAGQPVAVVMRTPGEDLELARGFVLSERIISRPDEVVSVRHCDVVEDERAEDNVVLVGVARGNSIDLAKFRRNMFAASSCGICGKASIDQVLGSRDEAVLPAGPQWSVAAIYGLAEALADHQPIFARTGALHAAALFDGAGRILAAREDVGRHNAVDKLIGWAVREERDLSSCGVFVSGRVSFEIVQKLHALRVPVVAAISAPSSLAVEFAARSNMTLLAFVRNRSLSAYAGAHRLEAT